MAKHNNSKVKISIPKVIQYEGPSGKVLYTSIGAVIAIAALGKGLWELISPACEEAGKQLKERLFSSKESESPKGSSESSTESDVSSTDSSGNDNSGTDASPTGMSFKEYVASARHGLKTLMSDWVCQGDICVIAGKTNAGKSVLTTQFAFNIAGGNKSELFDDEDYEPTSQQVILYDFENRADVLKERYGDIKINNVTMRFGFRRGQWKQVLADIEAQAKNAINDTTIILDNLTTAGFGNKESIDELYDRLVKIRDSKNKEGITLTFILVAHTTKIDDGKVDTNMVRGSGNITNYADSVIAIYHDDNNNVTYLELIKSRGTCKSDKKFAIRFDKTGYLHFERCDNDEPLKAEKGKRGPKTKVTQEDIDEAVNRIHNGEIPDEVIYEMALRCGVQEETVKRKIDKLPT